MERTYVGPLPRGTVTFPDDSTIAFERGVPVEVTPEQDHLLSRDPDWGGTEPTDDLDGLDKDALLAIVEAESVPDVSNRWGEARIADAIRANRRGDTPSEED
jgi:hypothetical protein